MLSVTAGAFFSAEGWLELEAHESDLRGSRGIAIAGGLMLFMGILNFKNTVSFRKPFLLCIAAKTDQSCRFSHTSKVLVNTNANPFGFKLTFLSEFHYCLCLPDPVHYYDSQ